MQCDLECKNCASLQKEKHRYKNLSLGAKHKLQCSRTDLNKSKMDATEPGNFYFILGKFHHS